jgi:translation elongation factor IF5A
MSTSKTGKHGHAKVNIVGLDIFTGKKYEDVFPSSHNVEVPFVDRVDYQVHTTPHHITPSYHTIPFECNLSFFQKK